MTETISKSGATPWAVEQGLVDAGSLTLSEAQSFVVTAMMVYPGVLLETSEGREVRGCSA